MHVTRMCSGSAMDVLMYLVIALIGMIAVIVVADVLGAVLASAKANTQRIIVIQKDKNGVKVIPVQQTQIQKK